MTEPEEIIESNIINTLSAANMPLEIIGALSPANRGEEKTAPISHISVACDLDSQDLDFRAGTPFSWSVRISVFCSFADDASGALFRNTCRAVRAAIHHLLGDGCSAISDNGFSCDAFLMSSTSTNLYSADESGGMEKTYNATIRGRFTPQSDE